MWESLCLYFRERLVKIFTFSLLIFAFNLHAEEVVFIGSPFSVVESKKSCDNFVESGICMDAAFELKYSVIEWFNTSKEPETIEFIGFTHSTGLPNYTSFNYALIQLKKVRGHYLVKDVKPIVELGDEYIICVSEQVKFKEQCSKTQTIKDYLGSL